MIKSIFCLLILTLPSVSKPGEWKTLKEKNYTLKYPSDWRVDKSGALNVPLMLYAPKDSEKDGFNENVNLIIESLEGKKTTLAEYGQISIEACEKGILGYKL